MSPPPALEARRVAAGYGGDPVITAIDLAVAAGDWLVLVGANGSGKSTLFKTLSGQIPLAGGAVTVAGHDLASARLAALSSLGMAVNPEDLPFPLTGRRYLEMVASARRCRPDAWPEPDLARMLAVVPWLDTPLGECSLGTRAKFAIAAALLGDPPVLLFDESLNGLDPVSHRRARDLLGRLARDRGRAILLSSHQSAVLATSGTRAACLRDGRIVRQWNEDALAAARRRPDGVDEMVVDAMAEPARPA